MSECEFECEFCSQWRLVIDRVIGTTFCIYCLEG